MQRPPLATKTSSTIRNSLDYTSDQTPAQCSYIRCRVTAIVDGNYAVNIDGSSSSSRTRPEKLLVLETDRHSKNANQTSPRKASTDIAASNEQSGILLASLRDDWLQTMVSVGNVVHLVGQFEQDTRPIPVVLDQQSRQDRKSEQHSASEAKIEVAIDQPAEVIARPNGTSGRSSTADSDDDDLWDDLASMPSLSQCATQEMLASAEAPKAKLMIFASRSSTLRGSDEVDHALANLFVIHPDVLVPATKVADVASCIRKPVVQDRLRGASDVTVSLVMGNMLHELLQACLTASSSPTITKVPRAARGDDKTGLAPTPVADSPASPWPEYWHGIGDFSRAFVEHQVEEQVRSNIESLYAIELSAEEAAAQLRDKAAPFAHFARTFLLRENDATFHSEATLHESGRSSTSAPAKVQLKRILDVEEEIWSPVFGLKGKIDVSVKCDILEASSGLHSTTSAPTRSDQAVSRGGQKLPGNGELPRRVTSSVVPLELKTGRAEVVSTEHRAQTMLYTLMMSDRYKVHVSDGLLYYSKSGELHRISRSRNEVRSLIIGRNELAHYLRHNPNSLGKSNLEESASELAQVLPPTIDSEYKCRRCYAVDGCMLYRRAIEQVVEPSEAEVVGIQGSNATRGSVLAKRTPIADIYEQKTQHLSEVHLAFFRKWDRLLSLEEEDAVRFRREMWTMTAEQREKVGRCFGNMRLDPDPEGSGSASSGSMRRVVHRFLRHHEPTQDVEAGLLSGHMAINDPVTISIEPDTLSVAQGFITQLTPTSVEIGLDHSLEAAMRRVLEQRTGRANAEPFDPVAAADQIVFRIDKDELGSGMGRVRANLASLLLPPQRGGDVKRRELIVEMRPPRFLDAGQLEKTFVPGLGRNSAQEVIAQVHADASLNQDQKLAIDKVLTAEDYALVLGMPGTGKTTTIAKLIELLVKLGKRVLLTSYTHSAVDTILRKLVEDPTAKGATEEEEAGMRILRLGSKDKVHPDARQFLLPRCTTLAELKEAFERPNVVAATCLSVHHSFFSSGMAKKLRSRHGGDETESSSAYLFDYCIVDEASQIPLPTCLGPLRFADKFVLVGDHHQLPPLVKNSEAKTGGLDVSLFKLLSDRYGDKAMVALRSQYRMNEEIMRLANELVYKGELKVGDPSVGARRLVLPKLEAAVEEGGGEGWMVELLQSESRVRLLDTSGRALEEVGESRQGEMVKNQFEAELVVRIASALIAGGCKPDQIAVVTPYRQQIKLLRSLFVHHSHSHPHTAGRQALQHIELLTADQSQGRDKDVILVTFTRANYSPPATFSGQHAIPAHARGNTGELLNDLRRLNVTLTRAKCKLILIGHTPTLHASPVLQPLLRLISEQHWLRKL